EVVGRVAAQRGVDRVLLGGDAGALLDACLVVQRVVAHASAVVEHLDVRVLHQLVGVPIAGDDDDVDPLVAGVGGEGGDDIVGLEAGRLGERVAQRLHDLAAAAGRSP